MRISDRYIGKQVLVGTLYAVIVLGVVLVLGRLFKEIQPLLVDMGAPIEMVARFVIGVLPLSLMYTVPWGFLSAVLLVFRRLSADQEITSFRVAGLSLVRLSVPVFVIGAALSCFSLWLNIKVVPNSKADLLQLLFDQGVRDPTSLLKPGVVQGDFGGDGYKKLLVEGRDGEWVEGFNLYVWPDKKADKAGAGTYVHARRAALSARQAVGQLRLKLEDAYFESRSDDGNVRTGYAGFVDPVVIDLKQLDQRKLKANSMSNEQIRYEIANDPELKESRKVKMQTEITTRYSLSMACLAFAFVAVPLGLQTRRRDTSFGLIMSLLIGGGYFMFVMMADSFDNNAVATMVLWSPNVICVLLGLFLFRRARFR